VLARPPSDRRGGDSLQWRQGATLLEKEGRYQIVLYVPMARRPQTGEHHGEQPRAREGELRVMWWNLPRQSMAWCGGGECRNVRARRIEESMSSSFFREAQASCVAPLH
jgi:hypothetical protein